VTQNNLMEEILGGEMMAILNRCLQCKGWMILDGNHSKWHVSCLQCEYSHYLDGREVVIEKKNDETWEKIEVPSY
jgi:hypothetical protein